MRPVIRPPNGKAVKNYQDFMPDLRQAFGNFCSYCENTNAGLDVEHVAPKSKNPALTLAWDNLLLGCPRCNRDYKKSKNDTRQGYIWPDEGDSFTPFIYESTGLISPRPGATAAAADATIKLCGLDRWDANWGRAKAFEIALRQRTRIETHPDIPVDDIIDIAQGTGYWSVWKTVFSDIPAMLAALLDPANFPGTRPRP